MPTSHRDDGKPVVSFDPRVEVSPFTLFRSLREGTAPLLIDVRERPAGKTLRGAMPMPDPDWRPMEDQNVVLFDDDGSKSVLLPSCRPKASPAYEPFSEDSSSTISRWTPRSWSRRPI